tara:strand:- start:70 stop:801 length:732 start_codon:yes stop_codon:yes gene_type:complete
MLKNLLKLANHLDAKGFTKEADYLDNILLKISEDLGETMLNPAGEFQDFDEDDTFSDPTKTNIARVLRDILDEVKPDGIFLRAVSGQEEAMQAIQNGEYVTDMPVVHYELKGSDSFEGAIETVKKSMANEMSMPSDLIQKMEIKTVNSFMGIEDKSSMGLSQKEVNYSNRNLLDKAVRMLKTAMSDYNMFIDYISQNIDGMFESYKAQEPMFFNTQDEESKYADDPDSFYNQGLTSDRMRRPF